MLEPATRILLFGLTSSHGSENLKNALFWGRLLGRLLYILLYTYTFYLHRVDRSLLCWSWHSPIYIDDCISAECMGLTVSSFSSFSPFVGKLDRLDGLDVLHPTEKFKFLSSFTLLAYLTDYAVDSSRSTLIDSTTCQWQQPHVEHHFHVGDKPLSSFFFVPFHLVNVTNWLYFHFMLESKLF